MWLWMVGLAWSMPESGSLDAPLPSPRCADGPGLRLHRGAWLTTDLFDPPDADPWPGLTPGASSAAWGRVADAVRQGRLPARGVRSEELLGALPADDAPPPPGEDLIVRAEAAQSPWEPDVAVLRIAVTTRRARADREPVHVAAVIDAKTEGDGGLAPVRAGLEALAASLRPDDTLALVDSAHGTLLPSVPVSERERIRAAIDGLVAPDASRYDLPAAIAGGYAAIEGLDGPSRVLLLSDGDLSLIERGDELAALVSTRAAVGVGLTAIGHGDLYGRDESVEALARAAGGSYLHLRDREDARALLGDQLSRIIEPVVTDLRLVVDWGPAVIGVHRTGNHHDRLLGLGPADRAGRELGAGQTAVVVYEVRLAPGTHDVSLGTVKVRATPVSTRIPRIESLQLPPVSGALSEASPELRLAVVTSTFAGLLGGTLPIARAADLVALAEEIRPEHEQDAELVEIVRLAEPLIRQPRCW